MSTLAQTSFRNLIQMNTRRDVLKLYKKCMRLSKEWIAKDPTKTEIERQAIANEARTRFRDNKSIDDETKVRALIKYTNDRIEIAKHYQIVYERPEYLPKGTKVSKKKKPIILDDQ